MSFIQDNWLFIARKMKMRKYSISAIHRTLTEGGVRISRSALYDALALRSYQDSGLPAHYAEYVKTSMYSDPPRRHEMLTETQVVQNLVIPGERGVVRDFGPKMRNSRGLTPQMDEMSELDATDLTDGSYEAEGYDEDISPNSFSFWGGDDNRTALQRYLDYERRSNEAESALPRWDDDGR